MPEAGGDNRPLTTPSTTPTRYGSTPDAAGRAGAPSTPEPTSPMPSPKKPPALPRLREHPNLLLAIVNPLSGERSAAAAVCNAFEAALGADRVVRLDGDAFRDPSQLRSRLRSRGVEHEALWQTFQSASPSSAAGGGFAQPLASGGLRRNATVLVAGGDGTVAFVMNCIQAAFAAGAAAGGANGAGAAIAKVGSAEVTIEQRAASSTTAAVDLDSPGGLRIDDLEIDPTAPSAASGCAVPAVGVFPMGTGNDLSFTLGFGLGFTRNHLCTACLCCPRDIDALLTATLAAPVVRFDRWQATISAVGANSLDNEAAVLKRVGFNNYVSFGMDADIARRFDEGRRGWPRLHRLRTMNKLWYGIHGLTATPMAPKFTNRNVALTCDGTVSPLPSASSNCKAVVVTNVLGYSGGVDLWKLKAPTMVELPRTSPSGAGFVQRRVPMQPNAVGDGRVEVQTLGGLVHMTCLRSGLIGADKVAQGTNIDLVVSDPSGTRGVVQMQADGEPLGSFHVPFRLQVRPAPQGPLFVHAAHNSLAVARSATAAVAY